MSYSILKTNGDLLTVVQDSTIDQTATNLTLIGKNSTSYGTFINDNFVWLLENFANDVQPSHPIPGQLWYDTSEQRLKVYDGSSFKVSGGTLVAPTVPSSLTTGDLWINSTTGQLYFNDGLANFLAGPIYTSAQGPCGFIVEDILDTNLRSHTVVLMYVANTLLGIYSKDAFTPSTSISGFNTLATFNASQSGSTLTVTNVTAGIIAQGMVLVGSNILPGTTITGFGTGNGNTGTYTVSTSATVASTTITAALGSINIGFTASGLTGIGFNVPVSQANNLIAADGSLKNAQSFLQISGDNFASGKLSIANSNSSTQLILGPSSNTEFNVSSGTFTVQSNSTDQNFVIGLESSTNGANNAVFIDARDQYIGLYNSTPAATLHVGTSASPGTVIIEGNLTVNGTTTSKNTATVDLEDYTITLAHTSSPSDITANGAGFIIKGGSDKTLQWSSATASWTSSENIDLASGNAYKIGTNPVLNSTTLGSSVINSSLRSVGTLNSLTSSGSIFSNSPTAGIGYATGSGGTVTQGVTKGNGVTLNAINGQITMNSASLSSGAIIQFTLTNSAISATDLVLVNHCSGGTLGAYSFATTPAAGSATIFVHNLSSVTLSEPIVLQFAVIKSVIA